jgi:hypothetical protein
MKERKKERDKKRGKVQRRTNKRRLKNHETRGDICWITLWEFKRE